MARTRKMTAPQHRLTDIKSPDNAEGKTKVLLPEALGTMVERSIQYRAPAMFRVQVRLRGVRQQEVLDTLEAAIAWRDEVEKAITGEGFVDTSLPARTTLKEACQWAVDRLKAIPEDKREANAKNLLSKWAWWADSQFGTWTLPRITDNELILWRTKVLNEDAGDDVEDVAAGASEAAVAEGNKPPSAQTIIHRLNALSRLYQDWRIAHRLPLEALSNPVRERVRPSKPGGRTRRLAEGEEERLLKAAENARPWLRCAVILAIETGMRQTELARLPWSRVWLDGDDPHAYLPETETKSGLPRTIPLSPRAIETFRELRDVVRPAMETKWDAREQKTEGAGFKWPAEKVLPVETGRGIIHAFREALSAAQAFDPTAFQDLVWHDLRHEAISRLFETTSLTETEIMSIVGHMGRDMLLRYTHHRSARLAKKMNSGRKKALEGHGSLRLPLGADPLVMDAEGHWIALLSAEPLYRQSAAVTLRAVLTRLEQAPDERACHSDDC